MPYGVSPAIVLLASLAAVVVAVPLVLWYRGDRAAQRTIVDATETVTWTDDDGTEHAAEVVQFPPSATRRSAYGVLGSIYQLYKIHRRERRLIDGGYVKWFKVTDGWPRPRYVKPSANGGGVPELRHDGGRYLFPERAMLPDAATGLKTAVHCPGDATPLNLHDVDEAAIPVDQLQEYFTATVSSSPPSWLSNIFGGIDPHDLLMYTVVGIIVLSVIMGIMG